MRWVSRKKENEKKDDRILDICIEDSSGILKKLIKKKC